MRQVIPFLIAIPLSVWLIRQCRKPSGPLGAGYLWLMNISHARLTDWGLSHDTVKRTDVVLDVGCGCST